jgi:hypothetical protein
MTIISPPFNVIRVPLNLGISSSLAKHNEHMSTYPVQGFSTLLSSINQVDAYTWLVKQNKER